MRLRIVSANMYMGNSTPGVGINRLVRRLGWRNRPDSIGLQEVGNFTKNLHEAKGYKVFYKDGVSRFTRSNAILVRRRLKVIDFEFVPAAAGCGTRTTPPRSILVLKYKKRGRKIAHLNTHLHVVNEEALAGTPESEYGKVARQYRDHSVLINDIVKSLRRKGYYVVVTGDINVRPKVGKRDWKYSVYRHIRDVGLVPILHGVDMVAYSGDLEPILVKEVPKEVTGSDDHNAIVVNFKTR